MLPDDRVRVFHMADGARAARRFAQGRSRADLDNDDLLVFALVRAVEVVGEAASRISAAGRSELPEIPWTQIVGMRNRLIHAYFDVDRTILWDTITQALPGLLAKLEAWISEASGESPPGNG